VPAVPFADFPLEESNAHRELAGQLSVPRTVAGVSRTIADLAPHYRYPEGKDARAVLKGLEKAGLVKRVGKHESMTAAVAAVEADEDAIDVPKQKAQRYAELAEGWKDTPRAAYDDELWILTKAGLEALTAPLPGEDPPLSGARLEAARREDEQWWERQHRIEDEGRAAEIERLKKRIAELRKEDDS
jgi:hypothetical protein